MKRRKQAISAAAHPRKRLRKITALAAAFSPRTRMVECSVDLRTETLHLEFDNGYAAVLRANGTFEIMRR